MKNNMSDTTVNEIAKASPNMRTERIEQLKTLFPDLLDGDGQLDEKALRTLISDEAGIAAERFSFEWAGKQKSKRLAFTPSRATLTYDPTRSLNSDGTENKAGEVPQQNTSENLIIEGDNLEALKLLQETYFEQIKCIYIDPPYNTGNDFIYPDNFTEGKKAYWEKNGTVKEGVKLTALPETHGRRHSDWLNFMQSRLLLARQMLRDDGVIFVSIDDNEVHNLRKLMDEIFGEENFLDVMIWKKRYGGGAKEKYLVTLHEYIVIFCKNKQNYPEITIALDDKSINRYYTQSDENEKIRGKFRTHPLEATKSMGNRPNLIFPIEAPDGTKIIPKRQWLWSPSRVQDAMEKGELHFYKKEGNWVVHTKQYLKLENGEIRQTKVQNIIDDVYTQHGTNEVLELFGNARIFPFPKPTSVVGKLFEISTNSSRNDVVLDMFSGSGTSAHAVMKKNIEDGGNRKHIMVQIPEFTDEKSEAYKSGYKKISDITIERVKRAGSKIREENPGTTIDTGFRVFKLTHSNFSENLFTPDADKSDEENIKALEAHLAEAAQMSLFDTDEFSNLVTEISLKNGFGLFYQLEALPEFSHNKIYRLHGNGKTTILCLDNFLHDTSVEDLKPFNEEQLIVSKSALDTSKKFSLQTEFKDNLWVV